MFLLIPMNRLTPSLLLAGLALALHTLAQNPAPASGKITYEGMRRVDLSQVRMVINGQEVRPGSADAPEALPEVISFTQKLVFSGTMAKEENDRQPNMMIRRTIDGGPGMGNGDGRPRESRLAPPFEQTSFLDLANRQRIEVMTVRKDSVRQTYRADRPMPAPQGWQLSDKTKKIAGYLCHKATTTYRMPRRPGRGDNAAGATPAPDSGPGEAYTIWYTTDLPFTYSPVAGLTPERGVVLQIESDSESFKATAVSAEPVAESSVQSPKDAKVISTDEMEQIRRKVMADFRQQMMNNRPFPGAGRN